jgi:hypothetical protein
MIFGYFARRVVRCAALLAVAGVAGNAGVAQAAVTISTKATTGITCAAGVCTATAKIAVLNVTDLTNLLAAGNVKVTPGKTAMDIVVAVPLSWVSTKRLTLNAYRAITFSQPTTLTGRGGLTLTTGNGGTLSFTGKGDVNFWDVRSSLIINGNTYTLVNDIATLATDVAANTSGHFALAKSYDAKPDGTYKAAPIAHLDGAFEGLGNTISNLKIALKTNSPADPWYGEAGLFGIVSATGSIENIAVTNAKVSAGDLMNAGILAGALLGTVANSHTSGTSTVGKGILTAQVYGSDAGGLVGTMDSTTAAVSNSYSTATVTGGDSSFAGGLIGGTYNGGTVVNSYATGNVIVGNNIFGQNQGAAAGGLIGLVWDVSGSSLINGDHATGTVTAGTLQSEAGGLIGADGGPVTIEFSYATGAVNVGTGTSTSAPDSGGGLLGSDSQLGGFSDTIKQSYATGAVLGDVNALVGGLVGYTTGSVSDCYATGAVSANGSGFTALGGLAGYATATSSVSTSYSTGNVQSVAGSWVGGFIGGDLGTLSSDDWDITTSEITSLSQGAGNVSNAAGVAGLSDATLQASLPAGFSSSIWARSATINNGLPYLSALPPT